MRRVLEKVLEEFLAMLPPTIFFFVWLHIVTVVRVLMAKGSHYQPLDTLSIAVWALILGKAVLLADNLPAINLYPHKPLIYNVTWKTAIYLLVEENMPVRPSWIGKFSTTFQLLTLAVALVTLHDGTLLHPFVLQSFIALSAAATVASGLQYLYRGLIWLQKRAPSITPPG